MTLLTVWPYLLMIPALLVGIALGWQLQLARQRRKTGQLAASASHAFHRLKHNHDSEDAKAELENVERELVSLTGAIGKASQQLADLEKEHVRILAQIDAREDELQDDRATLEQLRHNREDKQEQMLVDIDASGDEIEMLERMRETYVQRINRLSQRIEDQINELENLRSAHSQNVEATAQMRAEIRAQEEEYQRLLRQREMREADLDHVREQIAERTEALRTILEQQHDGAHADRYAPATSLRQVRCHDVTPAERPRLADRTGRRNGREGDDW